MDEEVGRVSEVTSEDLHLTVVEAVCLRPGTTKGLVTIGNRPSATNRYTLSYPNLDLDSNHKNCTV